MIVKAQLTAPSGFIWDVEWNSEREDAIIIGIDLAPDESFTMFQPDGSIDSPQAMSLIHAALDEWVSCSDFCINTATVDGVPLSEEFIEGIYVRYNKWRLDHGMDPLPGYPDHYDKEEE